MSEFESVYRALNPEQKQAVDKIDGPLLVIAGPGTGKTQLLSARVANILTKTDTPARNIMCLTFTENGAENMRQRLSSFIGQAAYDVTISTYHAFGGDLIRRFPEYFSETRLQNPVDELGQRQLIADIVEAMSYSNPLKQTRHHLGDLISTISEVKRALLTSANLRLIAAENLEFIGQASQAIQPILGNFSRMPAADKALPLFNKILDQLEAAKPKSPVNQRYGSLAQAAIKLLEPALQEAQATNKTTALTAWKNDWLVKDAQNHFKLAGELESQRIIAVADVLDLYQASLNQRGLYDFDDMILKAIEVLDSHDDLRFTLQEQYLYILLDEFQDTNPAQMRLVQLLTNNPVSEGRPNVMAVGDDDQAIYAFQGALYSNMIDFYKTYQDVTVINLTANYRSHPDILSTAQNIAEQIESRLHYQFKNVDKVLRSVNLKLPDKAIIERRQFLSEIAQSDWIADTIKSLINKGTSPSQIAILAPRHRQLEPLVPYLSAHKIPIHYEKRENILETQVIKQLLTMSRLVLALANHDQALADHLWPEVLSYEFWHLPIGAIWQVSWQVSDQRRADDVSTPSKVLTWTQVLLGSGEQFRLPALLFLALAAKVGQESCETMLDYLIGSAAVTTNEADLPQIYSPLRTYYTAIKVSQTQPELFYDALSNLTVLRAKLRDHQATFQKVLMLPDLITFVDMYDAAGERMVNTSPYNQQAEAVQVMTVFKAKGLEFEHVFLPSCQDEVWGGSSRTQNNHLTLPANLAPIRHAGANDDERLRILFVAATRAKFGLYLTNTAQNYNGKATKPLKYFDERAQSDDSLKDMILPESVQTVQDHDTAPPTIEQLDHNWHQRHIATPWQSELSALLANRLVRYQLSPTHLNAFLDLEYGGPEHFFFTTLLRFPEAPSADGQYGNAIHETLEWLQRSLSSRGALPTTRQTMLYFKARMESKPLLPSRIAIEVERGQAALTTFLKNRSIIFKPINQSEISFKNESVFVGEAHLAGKVDYLEIDNKAKTITVVDYKTGKSYDRWLSDAKLYRNKRQLCCYKILIEKSTKFAGYQVPSGRLEFIEPDSRGRINNLELIFNQDDIARTEKLLKVMWQHVQALNFPDVSQYDATLSGIRQFEQDLLDEKI